MPSLFAFGDSFILGDLDDFKDHSQDYLERIEFLKYNVSFVSHLSKYYELGYENLAVRGSGNFPQLDKLIRHLEDGFINEGDIVLFGITTLSRDRINILDVRKVKSYDFGPILVDRELVVRHIEKIAKYDLFYILSILDSIRTKHKIKIFAFNIFDNIHSFCKDADPSFYDFDFYFGRSFISNTLIDIVNDTWGQNISHPYHTQLNIPQPYRAFYTKHNHFSVLGHAKVFRWFCNQRIIDKLLNG